MIRGGLRVLISWGFPWITGHEDEYDSSPVALQLGEKRPRSGKPLFFVQNHLPAAGINGESEGVAARYGFELCRIGPVVKVG